MTRTLTSPSLQLHSSGEPRRRARRFAEMLVGTGLLLALSACGTDGGSTRKTGDNGSGGAGGNGGGGNGGSITPNVGGSGGVSTYDAGVPPSHDPMLPPVDSPFQQDDTGKSGLDGATIDALKMGGSSCTAPVIYPYEGTVVPAGGLPPIFQWQGAFDAAYVKMTYGDPNVSYEFAVGKGDPGRIEVPQDGWDGVSSRTPRPPAMQVPLQVTVSVQKGGAISTCPLKITVAPGKLDGVLYYNTYDDPQVRQLYGFAAGPQGSVMRLFLGQPKPDPFIWYTGTPMSGTGPCISCHSVSSNGSTMEATQHDYGMNKSYTVFGFDIKANPNPNPPKLGNAPITSATFGALTSDGSRLLTIGNPDCTAGAETYPRAPNNFPLVEGPVVARLVDINTGMDVNAKGLDPNYYMWMPQFSPNGDKVVFNHAKKGADGRTDRRELATMDFDSASNTFSNLQVIYHDDGPAPSLNYDGYTAMGGAGPIATGAGGCKPTGGDQYYPKAYWDGMKFNDTCTDVCYPGWPFFTPDGKKVIFVRGTQPDFAGAAPGLRPDPSKSQLFVVDVATKVAHPLTAANGDGVVPASEYGYEYFPTVMPIAAGGQFWIFWTSRRSYGNFPIPVPPLTLPGPPGVSNPDSKKIWVSAIDIDAPDSIDPSHPPFLLRGQGDSGNVRAFPTLSPCKGDGSACGSGIDCCGGYCIDGTCNPLPPTRTCAMLQEKCTMSSDCCESSQKCYGGFCAIPPPPK